MFANFPRFYSVFLVFLNLQIVSEGAEIVHTEGATSEIVFQKCNFCFCLFNVGASQAEEGEIKTKKSQKCPQKSVLGVVGKRVDFAKNGFFR